MVLRRSSIFTSASRSNRDTQETERMPRRSRIPDSFAAPKRHGGKNKLLLLSSALCFGGTHAILGNRGPAHHRPPGQGGAPPAQHAGGAPQQQQQQQAPLTPEEEQEMALYGDRVAAHDDPSYDPANDPNA
ncbi:unnamed protein product, partial [Amoebophrya sp. A25]|eukprot:GSA25T00019833001.1